ncbi:tetratricopeptide repeat protein [Rhodospirillaceae bacterium]|nr:tetratricopeptide repeat protein [Rhodospirillaceae bacterium]
MKITIDQILQQGIVAHKEGQLEKAKNIYEAVIKADPENCDANHNLGILANNNGKIEEAIYNFKVAVRTCPDKSHYWVSYINILIKAGQDKNAKIALEKAKNQGATGSKLEQIESILQKKATSYSLPQSKLQELIASFNQGNFQSALTQGRILASQFPTNSTISNILGAINFSVSNNKDAIYNYKRSIIVNPNYAEAYSNLGVILKNLFQHKESINWLSKALVIKFKFPQAHNNLGNTQIQLRKIEEAISSFRQAIRINPYYEEAYDNLCAALGDLERNEAALINLKKLICLRPHSNSSYDTLGIILNKYSLVQEAIYSHQKSITLAPACPKAHNHLASTLSDSSMQHEAHYFFKKAIILYPSYAEAYGNLGNCLTILRDWRGADINLSRAKRINQKLAHAHNNIGNLYQAVFKNRESILSYKRSLVLQPDHPKAYNNLGNASMGLGQHKEAITHFDRAIQLKKDYAEVYSNKYFCLHYSSIFSPSDIFIQHTEFERVFGHSKKIQHFSLGEKEPLKERLRIGYVSPDFKEHSVSYFFEPLLKNHNAERIETFCYYNDIILDETTDRLQRYSDHWRSIIGLSDVDVIKLIQKDRIDILVDLAGHTGKNRLLVFAQKPAPIQVTWLGYPNTTGLSAIDYRLTDNVADPIGIGDELYSEILFRLPNGFQCYGGDLVVVPELELPMKRNSYVTFGSFNNLSKMTPEVIKVWSKILHSVPNSRLLLKAKQLNHDAAYYLNFFEEEGISEDRLKLVGRVSDKNDHLNLYKSIDIGLDPFPFNGATTTCEALWMGVPVITLRGNQHVGRVGASILTNIGFTELIAPSIEDYVEIAIKMASDEEYLQTTRHGLRERMQNSPLCNANIFAKDIEAAYYKMWDKYVKSKYS